MNARNLGAALLFVLSATACQEVEQPTTVLTQEQWKEVQKNILETAPVPKYKSGAIFDDKIELIGFDVEGELKAGQEATIVWYWRVLEDVKDNWKVFVHLDSSGKPHRQNLDHVPVDGMFQTSRWKKGQIIKDVQKVRLGGNYPGGKAVPYFGWFKGSSRMKVTNKVAMTKEAQPRVIGPSLDIIAGKGSTFIAPTYNVLMVDGAVEMTIDGKRDEAVWKTAEELKLKPFGNAPGISTNVRAFVANGALYMSADLQDTHAWGTLKNRDDKTWTEEVFELFLDVNGDGKDYLELQVTPAGTIFDANFKHRLGRGEGSRDQQIDAAKAFNIPGLESAVDVVGTLNDEANADEKWTVELKVPLASIPGAGTPAENDEWWVNLYRFDRPAAGKSNAYAWSTGPRGDFHEVKKFGKFRFTKTAKKNANITPAMMKTIQRQLKLPTGKVDETIDKSGGPATTPTPTPTNP